MDDPLDALKVRLKRGLNSFDFKRLAGSPNPNDQEQIRATLITVGQTLPSLSIDRFNQIIVDAWDNENQTRLQVPQLNQNGTLYFITLVQPVTPFDAFYPTSSAPSLIAPVVQPRSNVTNMTPKQPEIQSFREHWNRAQIFVIGASYKASDFEHWSQVNPNCIGLSGEPQREDLFPQVIKFSDGNPFGGDWGDGIFWTNVLRISQETGKKFQAVWLDRSTWKAFSSAMADGIVDSIPQILAPGGTFNMEERESPTPRSSIYFKHRFDEANPTRTEQVINNQKVVFLAFKVNEKYLRQLEKTTSKGVLVTLKGSSTISQPIGYLSYPGDKQRLAAFEAIVRQNHTGGLLIPKSHPIIPERLLYLVQRIEQGGPIDVTTEIGRGATFGNGYSIFRSKDGKSIDPLFSKYARRYALLIRHVRFQDFQLAFQRTVQTFNQQNRSLHSDHHDPWSGGKEEQV